MRGSVVFGRRRFGVIAAAGALLGWLLIGSAAVAQGVAAPSADRLAALEKAAV